MKVNAETHAAKSDDDYEINSNVEDGLNECRPRRESER